MWHDLDFGKALFQLCAIIIGVITCELLNRIKI